jgi:cytochrome c556
MTTDLGRLSATIQESAETMLRAAAMVLVIALASLGAAMAADDPILERRQIMQKMQRAENAANSVILGKYRSEKAIAATTTLHEEMQKFIALFPEGSGEGNTRALPAVWENFEDFEARAAKFIADAKAAEAAAAVGQDAFTLAWQAVQADCQSCHEAYRAGALL